MKTIKTLILALVVALACAGILACESATARSGPRATAAAFTSDNDTKSNTVTAKPFAAFAPYGHVAPSSVRYAAAARADYFSTPAPFAFREPFVLSAADRRLNLRPNPPVVYFASADSPDVPRTYTFRPSLTRFSGLGTDNYARGKI